MEGQQGTAEGPAAPDLLEALRQLRDTGRSGLGSAKDATKALRTLVAADVSLARSAFGRTLAFTGVAIAFGASAWLLVMAGTVATLVLEAGWSWPLALFTTAGFSLLVTGIAGWHAMAYFEHTRMKATRRQLARLGIGELADHTPAPGSAASTKEATEEMPTQRPSGEAVKNDQGIDVTPP